MSQISVGPAIQRAKRYWVRRPCPPKYGDWIITSVMAVDDDRIIEAYYSDLLQFKGWDFVAFLIYAQAKGWKVDEVG